MKVTLTSYNKKHSFIIVNNGDELLFITENGKKIASLNVWTMTEHTDINGKFEENPTDNFGINFHAVDDGGMKNNANV